LAWEGLARCRLVLGEQRRAIDALHRCVEICPDMESARLQIRAIRKRMRESDV
jgi:hypothetical protein